MSDNILRATISVTAPGVQEAFNKVSNGAKEAENALKNIAPGLEKFKNELSNLPVGSINQLRAAAARLKTELQNLTPQQLQAGLGKGLSDTLKTVTAEMNALQKQAGITGAVTTNEFGKIYSSIRQIAFILPGIGIAGIFNLAFEAISNVVTELFSLNSGFSSTEIATLRFQQALDNLSKSAQNLKDSLDFQDDISKLKAQLAGLKGNELDIFDLSNRTSSADKIITNEEKIQQGLRKQRDEIEKTSKAYIEAGFSSTKFQQLAFAATQGAIIPKTLISELPKREQAIATAYTEILSKIEESQKRSSQAQEVIGKNYLQSQIDQANKLKEEREKSQSDYDKFVNATISEGKRLVSEFGKISSIHLSVLPEFTALDSKSEQFRKAQQVIKDVTGFFKDFGSKQRALNLSIPLDIIPTIPPLDPTVKERTQKEITEILKGVADFKPEPVDVKFDFSLDAAKKFDDFKEKLSNDIAASFNIKIDPVGLDETEKAFLKISQQAIFAAHTITDVLTPAFQDLFQSLVSGGDGFKAFFKGLETAVEQLISKIIAAAVEALVLAAIFGDVGGAKGFGAIFSKILGFEGGGRPPVGRPSVVGEKGPEIFKPDTGRPQIITKGLFTPNKPGTILTNEKLKEILASKELRVSKIEGHENYGERFSSAAIFKNILSKNSSFGKDSFFNDSAFISSLFTDKSISKTVSKDSTSQRSDVLEVIKSIFGSNFSNVLESKILQSEASHSNTNKSIISDSAKIIESIKSSKSSKDSSSATEYSEVSDSSRNEITNTIQRFAESIKHFNSFKEVSSFSDSLTERQSKVKEIFGYKKTEHVNVTDKQYSIISRIAAQLLSFHEIFKSLAFRAAGGPVTDSKMHVVGERGPEIFVPKVSGAIIPHHKIQSFTKNLLGGDRSKVIDLSKTFNSISLKNIMGGEKKFLSSINNFGGFKAGGGAVQGGKLFIVGESGAELFVPSTGANIREAQNFNPVNVAASSWPTNLALSARVSGNDLLLWYGNARRSQNSLV